MEQLTSQPTGDADLVHTALSAQTAPERTAAFEAIAGRYRSEVLRQCSWWFPNPDAAQDVGQITFEAAFRLLANGKGPARPDKLGGWLIEIAKRRAKAYRRRASPPGVTWAVLPEDRSLDDLGDDEEPRSGSAVRRAHATRLVEAVVATLTERQQQVYQLRFVQELTGRDAAGQLGITEKTASNLATNVQALIADGFGALILFQEGRAYCTDLARIIDTTTAAAGGTATFSTELRARITRHFGTCPTCDDCRTCDNKRRDLVGPYVPGLIPILFAARFRDRIDEAIRRIAQEPSQDRPRRQDPGTRVGAAAGAALLARTAAPPPAGPGTGNGAGSAGQPPGGRPGGGRGVVPDFTAGQGEQGRGRRRRALAGALAVLAMFTAGGITAAVLAGSNSPAPSAPAAAARIPAGAIQLTASSGHPAAGGDVYVTYQGGQHAQAQLHGTIEDTTAGEVTRLYAQPFPYTSPPEPAGTLPLHPAGGTSPFIFTVTPDLATRYTVEVFRDSTATAPLATSQASTVYVAPLQSAQINQDTCNSGTCQLSETFYKTMPSAALSTEMPKQAYTYFAYGTPGPPAQLQLGAGSPQVSAPQQVSATEFSVTITFTYADPGQAYQDIGTWCSQDTETQDGIGLPGPRGCGAPSYDLSTDQYLG